MDLAFRLKNYNKQGHWINKKFQAKNLDSKNKGIQRVSFFLQQLLKGKWIFSFVESGKQFLFSL